MADEIRRGTGGAGNPPDGVVRAYDRLTAVKDALTSEISHYSDLQSRVMDIQQRFAHLASTVEGYHAENIASLKALESLLASLAGNTLMIRSEVSGIVSDSNKTNHVVVYAMAYDANGFYAAPSANLLSALEAYLSTRRLINVTVECVSGMSMIKKCSIAVQLKTLNGYSSSTVRGNVFDALVALLKNRNFGESLYLSTVYDAIMNVVGVDYAKATISSVADSDYIIDGNFDVSGTSYVISKDDGAVSSVITVTEI